LLLRGLFSNLLYEFHLDLLDLKQPVPLMREELVHFRMEVPNLQFGFQEG
jgi:hypothetical protein